MGVAADGDDVEGDDDEEKSDDDEEEECEGDKGKGSQKRCTVKCRMGPVAVSPPGWTKKSQLQACSAFLPHTPLPSR